MRNIFKILLLSFTLLPLVSLSQLMPGDETYQEIKSPNKKTSIYYSQADSKVAQKVHSTIDSLNNYYESSFGFKLDENLHLVLASSTHNQILNGFSTQFPHNLTFFYSAGALDPDYFAGLSWVDTLVTHELAHNYQMNSKKSWVSKSLNFMFGNTPTPFILFFPFPNIFLPTFIVEGNAVLNESTYKNGGRLFSGELRALVFSYLKENKLTANSLINTKLEFPYGATPYMVGGYFHAYLARRFGMKKVNSFFENNSESSITILGLDNAFIKTFGRGYQGLLKGFINFHKDDILNLKYLSGKKLATSLGNHSLTKQNNKILFMTSSKAGLPSIHTYNVKNKSLISKSGGWKVGKPFNINNNLYTRSSQLINSTHRKVALFDEDGRIYKNSIGRSYQDIEVIKNKLSKLWLRTHDSAINLNLIKNKKNVGTTHSSAILDKSNNHYYFKNWDKNRTLYKNKTPLFSYKGYWGFPVEVTNKAIYFIAPTPYGSTLYKFSLLKKEITRLSIADNIIDAKMIDRDNFIATTITGKSYNIIIGKVNKTLKDQPFEISYPFENSSLSSLPEKKIKFKNKTKNSYNSLFNLKLSNFAPLLSYVISGDDSSFNMYLPLTFVDPLLINSFSLGYLKSENLEGVITRYENKRYRLQYSITGTHFKIDNEYIDPFWQTRNPSGKGGNISFLYPLFKQVDQSVNLKLEGHIDYEDSHKNPLIFKISYNKTRHFGIATKPEFLHDFSVSYKYDQNGYGNTEKGNVSIFSINYGIGKGFNTETFLKAHFKYSKSNAGDAILLHEASDYNLDQTDFKLDSLDYNYYVQEIASASISIFQTFYFSAYSNWFPLGVRREDLFIEFEAIKLDYNKRYFYLYKILNKENITELRIGIDFEFLGVHKTPFSGRITWIKNSENFSENKMRFSMGTDF